MAYTIRKPAGFKRVSRLAGGFAVLGVAAMYAQGADIVQKYHIDDPSSAVARDLAGRLAAAKSGRLAEMPIALDRDDLDSVARAVGGALYVIDAQTIGWGVEGQNFAMQMKLRVLDAASKRVVATDRCVWLHKKGADGAEASKIDLLDEDAKGLKAQIAQATAACAQQFWIAAAKL